MIQLKAKNELCKNAEGTNEKGNIEANISMPALSNTDRAIKHLKAGKSKICYTYKIPTGF
jgi:hypothetical protein